MSTGTPARSTPQLDLMRRLKVRDAQHGNLAMPFLEEEERERLSEILEASVEHGITNKVQRRAHDFLVMLGERDATLRFLNDEERQQLTALIKLTPPPAPKQKRKRKQKATPKKKSMSAGEFLVIICVMLSVAAAAFLTYQNPATVHSAFWVGVWGLLMGGSFVGDARRRSKTEDGAVSAPEGFLVGLVWAIAAAAIVLLGSHHVLSPGWAAFWSFLGATGLSEAILKIDSSDDDDWDDWDDD